MSHLLEIQNTSINSLLIIAFEGILIFIRVGHFFHNLT